MGFAAGCPIAGVIWQHIHYIVGLQRLGHEVYYIEDSARLPYNPRHFRANRRLPLRRRRFWKSWPRQFGFEGRWSYCARYLPETPCAGLRAEAHRRAVPGSRCHPERCGSQEFNEDLLQSDRILYVESDPGVEQIKVDKGEASTIDYLQEAPRALHFRREHRHAGIPRAAARLSLAAHPPAGRDRFLERPKRRRRQGAVFTSVANWNTSGKKDIEWRGEKYLWSKSLEFLKFIEAPRTRARNSRLATTINDAATRERFAENGWRFTAPSR